MWGLHNFVWSYYRNFSKKHVDLTALSQLSGRKKNFFSVHLGENFKRFKIDEIGSSDLEHLLLTNKEPPQWKIAFQTENEFRAIAKSSLKQCQTQNLFFWFLFSFILFFWSTISPLGKCFFFWKAEHLYLKKTIWQNKNCFKEFSTTIFKISFETTHF